MPEKEGRRVAEPNGARQSTTRTSKKTIDLYVRSLAPRGQQTTQNAIINRLDELESMGAISAYTVHVWGRKVAPLSAAGQTEAGQFISDQVTAFETWADDVGRSLDSFFETQAVQSAYRDETHETSVLPAATLAEYEGDTLTFVAPSTDGDTSTTVHDRLDALERAHTTTERDRPPVPGAPTGRNHDD